MCGAAGMQRVDTLLQGLGLADRDLVAAAARRHRSAPERFLSVF